MKPDVTMKINLLLQMGIAHGRSLNYPEGGDEQFHLPY